MEVKQAKHNHNRLNILLLLFTNTHNTDTVGVIVVQSASIKLDVVPCSATCNKLIKLLEISQSVAAVIVVDPCKCKTNAKLFKNHHHPALNYGVAAAQMV